jgi:hypothetical protein
MRHKGKGRDRSKYLLKDVGALHLCISPLRRARCTTVPLSKFLSCVLITLGYVHIHDALSHSIAA